MDSRLADRLRTILYPAVFLVIVLAAWHFGVRFFKVPDYVLPSPQSVFESFRDNQDTLWQDTVVTLLEMGAGFLIAVFAGVLLGSLIAQSKIVSLTIYPYLVALSTVPIVALAPLLIIWMGYGLSPKIAVSALIAFLPIVINTVRGLKSADYRAILLMDSIAASKLAIFTKIRLPSAMPYLFSAFKIAVPTAVVGAVVGEFLGSDKGLGAMIIRATSRLQMDVLFVAILVLGVMGITLFLLVSLLERVLMRWYDGATTL